MKGMTEQDNVGMPLFELFEDGACCEDTECPTRELWPMAGETREQFVARLKATYSRISGDISMTITSIHRNGALLPPGCIDGFCATCKRESVVSETDPRCPYCQRALDPRSLPSAPGDVRTVAQAVQSGAETASVPVEPVRAIAARNEAVAAKPEVKPVTLPPTRAALTWDRATDALLAAAEDAEATAKRTYETARAEYQAARQQAHMIRQLRQLARVDGAPEKPVKAARIKQTHAGRCVAPGPCIGCMKRQEAQTNGN